MKKKGRPESTNAAYFSHSVHQTDVLKLMVLKFGFEGYTAYFRLLEQSAKAAYHRIVLQKSIQKEIFLINMGVREEVIDFLISVLLDFDEMDRYQWESNQIIYLNKFVKQFKKLWYDRGKEVPKADGTYNVLSIQKHKKLYLSCFAFYNIICLIIFKHL